MSVYSHLVNFFHYSFVNIKLFLGIKINGAQAIVRRGDEVLLVKTTYRPCWGFPGGKIERHESPESAAIRETVEEAGVFIASIERKLGAYISQRWHMVVIVYVYIAAEWEEGGSWEAHP